MEVIVSDVMLSISHLYNHRVEQRSGWRMDIRSQWEGDKNSQKTHSLQLKAAAVATVQVLFKVT
jgi:hypothetical protein